MTDKFSLLKLLSIPKIGNQRIRQLISKFGSPERALEASVNEIKRINGFSSELSQSIVSNNGRKFAENQLRLLDKYDSELISFWDDDYPELLKNIYDPPVLLFLRGKGSIKTSRPVAIVGTRKPSAYGKNVAVNLSRELTSAGFTIVSGFARGIDSISHKTCCVENGNTIGVLGNGIDIVYPPENRTLIPQILETGILLSEFPIGTKPGPGNFPMRNRIIAGLSLGTIVIEAGVKSGALITAMYANDYGREVFAVPGQIFSPKSSGTHKLIKSGAKLVENIDDVLDEFSNILSIKNKKEQQQTIIKSLSPDEQNIWDLLEEPVHIDKLSSLLKIPTSKVLSTLLIMELNGVVNQLPGKMFVRNY